MPYSTSPKTPDKGGTDRGPKAKVTPERSQSTPSDSHNQSPSPTNHLTADTDAIHRDHPPLNSHQKRQQAAIGQTEVDHLVEEIQKWLDWDAEFTDCILVHNLSPVTISRLTHIQEILILCCNDEEMQDGEHDVPDRWSDNSASPRERATEVNDYHTETIRNLSRANVILAEEIRTLKTEHAHTHLHPQTPNNAGLGDSIHVPTHRKTFTKSANPIPITPEPKRPPTPKTRLRTNHSQQQQHNATTRAD